MGEGYRKRTDPTMEADMFVTKKRLRLLERHLEMDLKVIANQDRLINRLMAEIESPEEGQPANPCAFSRVSPGQGADHTLSRGFGVDIRCSCGWVPDETRRVGPAHQAGEHMWAVTPIEETDA